MSRNEILRETRNHIAFITLNRPAALNALSLGMVIELRAILAECAADASVYAVLIRGAGEKAFCAGGDIRAIYDSYQSAGVLHRDFFITEYPLDYLLHAYPKPYIALLDGIVMGGGMGLAQGSTLRIVGERTRMAMPEVAIGFFPDVGASYFLSRLEGSLGTYLALTGLQIRAADALYAGLADVFLPRAAVDALDSALSAMPWTGSDLTARQAALKAVIQKLAGGESPAPSLAVLREGIDRHFAATTVPALMRSLEDENRPELAQWAQQTLDILNTRSPTMLAVTLQQLQRGRTLNLAECLRMELGLVWRCFAQGDFMEGVRAVVIDKDNSPVWQPPHIDDVTDASVDAMFTDPWAGGAHPLANL